MSTAAQAVQKLIAAPLVLASWSTAVQAVQRLHHLIVGAGPGFTVPQAVRKRLYLVINKVAGDPEEFLFGLGHNRTARRADHGSFSVQA